MNEEQIITKIQSEYLADTPNNNFITLIPRNMALDQFSDIQKSSLDTLIAQHINLLIKITFRNLKNNQLIEFGQDHQEKIMQHPADYSIERISFNFSSAFIWLNIYYDAEVKLLAEQHVNKPKINLSYQFGAIVTSVLCFYFFFALHNTIAKVMQIIIFAFGFLALLYIFETLKKLLPKEKQLKTVEDNFLVAQYLAFHLELCVTDYFQLDINELQ